MKPCRLDELARDPAGRWMSIGSGVVWCRSPTLCGVAMWGRPGTADVEALLRAFDCYRGMAPRFDLVQDGSALEAIDPDALAMVLAWLSDNREVLQDRVRKRVALVPPGLSGLALAGIGPSLGLSTQVIIVSSPAEAFREVLAEGSEAVCEQVRSLIASVRDLPPLLVALRRVLAESRGALDLAEAAQRLHVPERSLQRLLAGAGTTFRSEQAEARFRAAEELLRTADKLSAVAARLGLSEGGLIALVRAHTGLTPSEFRRRLLGAD